ncbi:hypothetical protein [Calothrix rhizosoleniae]|uniref:hypothetical protein n=1 Tax=Calothrix rhizosoleniae TaxID=888997 RepID=UPI0030DB9FC5
MTQEASTEERILAIFTAIILSRTGDWLDEFDRDIRARLYAIIENQVFIQDFYEYLNRQEQDIIRNILSLFPKSIGVQIGVRAPTFKIKREAIFLANALFYQSECPDIEIGEIIQPLRNDENIEALNTLILAGDWLDEYDRYIRAELNDKIKEWIQKNAEFLIKQIELIKYTNLGKKNDNQLKNINKKANTISKNNNYSNYEQYLNAQQCLNSLFNQAKSFVDKNINLYAQRLINLDTQRSNIYNKISDLLVLLRIKLLIILRFLNLVFIYFALLLIGAFIILLAALLVLSLVVGFICLIYQLFLSYFIPFILFLLLICLSSLVIFITIYLSIIILKKRRIFWGFITFLHGILLMLTWKADLMNIRNNFNGSINLTICTTPVQNFLIFIADEIDLINNVFNKNFSLFVTTTRNLLQVSSINLLQVSSIIIILAILFLSGILTYEKMLENKLRKLKYIQNNLYSERMKTSNNACVSPK